MNSRDKGKRGELEFRDYLRERGYAEAERGQQRSGSADSPDVIGGPAGLHVEVKRTERFNLYDALDQSVRDAGSSGRVPYVAHRCNATRSKNRGVRGSWIAVIRMDDFFEMYEALQHATARHTTTHHITPQHDTTPVLVK